MTDDEASKMYRDIGRNLCDALLDDWRFRQAVKEAALRAIAEYERLREIGVARGLLERCDMAGVSFSVGDHGKIECNGAERLSPELRRMLKINWNEVKTWIRWINGFKPSENGKTPIQA